MRSSGRRRTPCAIVLRASADPDVHRAPDPQLDNARDLEGPRRARSRLEARLPGRQRRPGRSSAGRICGGPAGHPDPDRRGHVASSTTNTLRTGVSAAVYASVSDDGPPELSGALGGLRIIIPEIVILDGFIDSHRSAELTVTSSILTPGDLAQGQQIMTNYRLVFFALVAFSRIATIDGGDFTFFAYSKTLRL